MKYVSFLKSASGPASALTIISVTLLLFKMLYLNKFPAIFPGAYELGVIVEAVLASVIASYIFYLIVVHTKEVSDKDTIRPYVTKHSQRLVNNCNDLIDQFSKLARVKLDTKALDSQELEKALSKISPRGQAPLVFHSGAYANWIEYIKYSLERSSDTIRKLFDKIIFLDAELVSILTEIDDCDFIAMMSHIPSAEHFRNTGLEFLSGSMLRYVQACQKLEAYLKK